VEKVDEKRKNITKPEMSIYIYVFKIIQPKVALKLAKICVKKKFAYTWERKILFLTQV
jgi:hypothetical protein